jgi:hypothetical protein
VIETNSPARDTSDGERRRTEGSQVVSSRVTLWVGRILSALPVLMMVLSSLLKLTDAPGHAELMQNWGSKFGYPESLLTPIGLLELACVIIYLIPRTAVLGCVLVSSYLAAAFATHLRIGDPDGGVFPLLLAVFAWAGLYLRDERVRSLLPVLRKREV